MGVSQCVAGKRMYSCRQTTCLSGVRKLEESSIAQSDSTAIRNQADSMPYEHGLLNKAARASSTVRSGDLVLNCRNSSNSKSMSSTLPERSHVLHDSSRSLIDVADDRNKIMGLQCFQYIVARQSSEGRRPHSRAKLDNCFIACGFASAVALHPAHRLLQGNK